MRLIDADALIQIFEADEKALTDREFQLAAIGAANTVREMPTVDAEPVRHGRWEKVRGHQMVRRCSECGDIVPRDRAFIHYIYCGHCGARMDKDEID